MNEDRTDLVVKLMIWWAGAIILEFTGINSRGSWIILGILGTIAIVGYHVYKNRRRTS